MPPDAVSRARPSGDRTSLRILVHCRASRSRGARSVRRLHEHMFVLPLRSLAYPSTLSRQEHHMSRGGATSSGRAVPIAWRRRHYRVERVLETWIVETGWWKDGGRVSSSYWRVRAAGRVFDLRYDRIAKAWALERALN